MTGRIKLLIFALKGFILLNFIHSVTLQEDEEARLTSELQLDDLELIDMCEDLASACKDAFLNFSYHNKIEQEQHYGAVLKRHYEVLREFKDVPLDIERNWTYQVKPGDSLLPQEKWDKLVLFRNRKEELTREFKLFCNNQNVSCLIGKSDYQAVLNNERKLDTLKETWQKWQNIYNNSDIEEFKYQLGLVKEAALLNGFQTVKEYWEELTDFTHAYQEAESFWGEISPFYKKLQKFVQTRLFKFHNLYNSSEDIPVYLLGGELGTDWSNIAPIILPHPQLHYDVESYLKYQDMKDMFGYSETVTANMGFGSLGDKFWRNSNFNSPFCDLKLFEFCGQEYTEITVCNKTSWPVYLKTHETALKIALNNLDYASLPRQQLRYCAIDDAVTKLGTLLAVDSLVYHGILEDSDRKAENSSEQMTKLLLTALKVMPNLAYSLMADKWRMEVIEQNPLNIAETWWKYRKEYMGVQGILNRENDYLDDVKILSNKPYISDFFGTLIAFQLFSYYKERSEGTQHIIKDFAEDVSFIGLIKGRHSTDWPYLLSIHYGLDLGTAELLKYFEPLEEYFETAPLEPVSIVTRTTTSTSTTTTSTTTESSEAKLITKLENELVNDQPKANLSSVVSGGTADVAESHVAMYVGVGLLMLVGCSLAAAFVYKNLRRRRRTNNRRFDT